MFSLDSQLQLSAGLWMAESKLHIVIILAAGLTVASMCPGPLQLYCMAT